MSRGNSHYIIFTHQAMDFLIKQCFIRESSIQDPLNGKKEYWETTKYLYLKKKIQHNYQVFIKIFKYIYKILINVKLT